MPQQSPMRDGEKWQKSDRGLTPVVAVAGV